jgi:hypothetical protein
MTTTANEEKSSSAEVIGAPGQNSPGARDCVRCPVCNRLLRPAQLADCPTCHTDNTSWGKMGTMGHVSHFPTWLKILIAGLGLLLYVLLLAAGVIILISMFWPEREIPAPGQALLPGLAGHGGVLLLCIIIAGVIFASRHSLRHYALRRQSTPGEGRPSLGAVGVTLMIMALILVVAILLGRQSLTGGELTFASVRDVPGTFWIAYAILLPCALLAAMLFGVNSYLHNLDERYARPACCDPELLCAIAKSEIEDTYLGPKCDTTSAGPTTDAATLLTKPSRSVDIVSSKRNAVGGLDLVICHTCERWAYNAENGAYLRTAESKIYEASTDQWGKVQVFGERSPKRRTPGQS